ncbi:MAG: helix-turn-helix domain-containing protein, partial [Candidatus Omnitrophica bacterium]|nr:helix-turn-helix domain-containing protein [Candidatus Omnitrophota bacterium]
MKTRESKNLLRTQLEDLSHARQGTVQRIENATAENNEESWIRVQTIYQFLDKHIKPEPSQERIIGAVKRLNVIKYLKVIGSNLAVLAQRNQQTEEDLQLMLAGKQKLPKEFHQVIRRALTQLIGEVLYSWRTKLEISQEALAASVKLSPSSLARLERGNQLIELEVLSKIVAVLSNAEAELQAFLVNNFADEMVMLQKQSWEKLPILKTLLGGDAGELKSHESLRRQLNEKLGRRIAFLRRSLNISAQQLALELDIDFTTMSRYENGHILMSYAVVKSIVQLLRSYEVVAAQRLLTKSPYVEIVAPIEDNPLHQLIEIEERNQAANWGTDMTLKDLEVYHRKRIIKYLPKVINNPENSEDASVLLDREIIQHVLLMKPAKDIAKIVKISPENVYHSIKKHHEAISNNDFIKLMIVEYRKSVAAVKSNRHRKYAAKASRLPQVDGADEESSSPVGQFNSDNGKLEIMITDIKSFFDPSQLIMRNEFYDFSGQLNTFLSSTDASKMLNENVLIMLSEEMSYEVLRQRIFFTIYNVLSGLVQLVAWQASPSEMASELAFIQNKLLNFDASFKDVLKIRITVHGKVFPDIVFASGIPEELRTTNVDKIIFALQKKIHSSETLPVRIVIAAPADASSSVKWPVQISQFKDSSKITIDFVGITTLDDADKNRVFTDVLERIIFRFRNDQNRNSIQETWLALLMLVEKMVTPLIALEHVRDARELSGPEREERIAISVTSLQEALVQFDQSTHGRTITTIEMGGEHILVSVPAKGSKASVSQISRQINNLYAIEELVMTSLHVFMNERVPASSSVDRLIPLSLPVSVSSSADPRRVKFWNRMIGNMVEITRTHEKGRVEGVYRVRGQGGELSEVVRVLLKDLSSKKVVEVRLSQARDLLTVPAKEKTTASGQQKQLTSKTADKVKPLKKQLSVVLRTGKELPIGVDYDANAQELVWIRSISRRGVVKIVIAEDLARSAKEKDSAAQTVFTFELGRVGEVIRLYQYPDTRKLSGIYFLVLDLYVRLTQLKWFTKLSAKDQRAIIEFDDTRFKREVEIYEDLRRGKVSLAIMRLIISVMNRAYRGLSGAEVLLKLAQNLEEDAFARVVPEFSLLYGPIIPGGLASLRELIIQAHANKLQKAQISLKLRNNFISSSSISVGEAWVRAWQMKRLYEETIRNFVLQEATGSRQTAGDLIQKYFVYNPMTAADQQMVLWALLKLDADARSYTEGDHNISSSPVDDNRSTPEPVAAYMNVLAAFISRKNYDQGFRELSNALFNLLIPDGSWTDPQISALMNQKIYLSDNELPMLSAHLLRVWKEQGLEEQIPYHLYIAELIDHGMAQYLFNRLGWSIVSMLDVGTDHQKIIGYGHLGVRLVVHNRNIGLHFDSAMWPPDYEILRDVVRKFIPLRLSINTAVRDGLFNDLMNWTLQIMLDPRIYLAAAASGRDQERITRTWPNGTSDIISDYFLSRKGTSIKGMLVDLSTSDNPEHIFKSIEVLSLIKAAFSKDAAYWRSIGFSDPAGILVYLMHDHVRAVMATAEYVKYLKMPVQDDLKIYAIDKHIEKIQRPDLMLRDVLSGRKEGYEDFRVLSYDFEKDADNGVSSSVFSQLHFGESEYDGHFYFAFHIRETGWFKHPQILEMAFLLLRKILKGRPDSSQVSTLLFVKQMIRKLVELERIGSVTLNVNDRKVRIYSFIQGVHSLVLQLKGEFLSTGLYTDVDIVFGSTVLPLHSERINEDVIDAIATQLLRNRTLPVTVVIHSTDKFSSPVGSKPNGRIIISLDDIFELYDLPARSLKDELVQEKLQNLKRALKILNSGYLRMKIMSMVIDVFHGLESFAQVTQVSETEISQRMLLINDGLGRVYRSLRAFDRSNDWNTNTHAVLQGGHGDLVIMPLNRIKRYSSLVAGHELRTLESMNAQLTGNTVLPGKIIIEDVSMSSSSVIALNDQGSPMAIAKRLFNLETMNSLAIQIPDLEKVVIHKQVLEFPEWYWETTTVHPQTFKPLFVLA